MGRGQETDLLFNPPRIHRDKKPSISRGRRGAFERPVSDLVVGISFNTGERLPVVRGHDGELRFLDENFQETRGRQQNITDDALLVASGNNVAWGEGEGFALRQNANPENPLSFRTGPGGQVLALHLSDDHLYCLRHEEGTVSDTVLEKIALEDFDNEAIAWTRVESSDGPVKATGKGENTVLWFAGSSNAPPHLICLNRKGVGPVLNVSHNQALLDVSKNPLIIPGEETGEYFLISIDEAGVKTLHHLEAKGKSSQKNYLGDSRSEEIATLSPNHGQEIRDIAWMEDKGVILTDKELLLFDREGLQENLALEQRGDDSYDQLSLLDDKILLWKRGSDSYLEVNIS